MLVEISVIFILKDRIEFPENELPEKDTIIDFISKQFTASKQNELYGNVSCSCSVNIHGIITITILIMISSTKL